MLVSSVTATNNYAKEGQFRSLSKVSDDKRIKVFRNSEESVISIYDVNVGDIVILETGDKVPADGLYISGYDLRIDQSVMTGESDAVKKDEDRPWISSQSQVAEGVGRMLITAVGPHSEWGRTLSRLIEKKGGKKQTEDEENKEDKEEEEEDDDDDDETPLQKKLGEMAKNIGKVGLVVATIVFFVLAIYWAVDLGTGVRPWKWAELRKLVDFFIIGVTIVVVAVPEGLPLAVTISLAYSMKQMYKDKNLVRHLAACETMGGATSKYRESYLANC